MLFSNILLSNLFHKNSLNLWNILLSILAILADIIGFVRFIDSSKFC